MTVDDPGEDVVEVAERFDIVQLAFSLAAPERLRRLVGNHARDLPDGDQLLDAPCDIGLYVASSWIASLNSSSVKNTQAVDLES
jgi:hypothetical protein